MFSCIKNTPALQALILALTICVACCLTDPAQAKKKKNTDQLPATDLTTPTLGNTMMPVPVTSPLDALNGAQPPSAPHFEFLDLSSAKFDKLDLDLVNSRFSNAQIDKLHITATNMDFRAGVLKGLSIDTSGGHFQDFVFDRLTLDTQGDLNFNPNLLQSSKVLQFLTPAEATVFAVVSQDSLNAFINSPRTLEKLSVKAGKSVGMIASLIGANPASFGVTLSDASVALQNDNHIAIGTKATVGIIGVPLPLELTAKLDLANGWVAFSDTHLNTNGQEISPQLSEMLVKKMNGLAGWGSKSEDIQFGFSEIKVIPGKQFMMRGTARINRLRF